MGLKHNDFFNYPVSCLKDVNCWLWQLVLSNRGCSVVEAPDKFSCLFLLTGFLPFLDFFLSFYFLSVFDIWYSINVVYMPFLGNLKSILCIILYLQTKPKFSVSHLSSGKIPGMRIRAVNEVGGYSGYFIIWGTLGSFKTGI